MSSGDQAVAAAIASVATAFDGAVTGVGLAFFSASSWAKYLTTSSALNRIRGAPSAKISDLRSLLPSDDEGGGRLVVVRGEVQPRLKIAGSLVSQGSGERAVLVQQTQTCLYNEWRGIFRRGFDLHTLFSKGWKEQQLNSLRSVPFNLVEGGHWPNSRCVCVSFDGSNHPLPLTSVYQHVHPVQATPFSFFQAIFGHGYPVALLDEEKILPVGKEISAIGICRTRDGDYEIKSCKDLPFFLTDMTKDEIEADLTINAKILFWSGIVLGTLSATILGYAIIRNWLKWRDFRKRQRQRQESEREDALLGSSTAGGDELEDVADGELCVICLVRRRRSAFVPCGHRVCCPQCAISVQLNPSPYCPVCRQSIRSSIRIYDS